MARSIYTLSSYVTSTIVLGTIHDDYIYAVVVTVGVSDDFQWS